MEKKRLGIITFHRANNIGAVLQCYALQYALESNFSVSVEIIDYHCPAIEQKPVLRGIRGNALRIYYWIKASGFKKFRKQFLNLSPSCNANTIHLLNNRYHALVTGSDQVWNYECSNYDNAYFLNFAPSTAKKYSYAASLGNYEFSDNEKSKVRELLKSFNSISVREESSKLHLAEFLNKSISVLPDPVLLLDTQTWKNLMSHRLLKQKYVFVYLIQPDVYVLSAATNYAKANNCRIICNKISWRFIFRGSPVDFLSWVYHAECVFTNSFHGTVFSLIFGKRLGAEINLKNGQVNKRVQEILEKTGNHSCIITSPHDIATQTNSDMSLDTLRKDAFDYLAAISR